MENSGNDRLGPYRRRKSNDTNKRGRYKDTKEVYKIATYYEEKANEFAKILLEDIRDRISKVGQNYYDYDQGVYNQYYKNLKKGK